MRNQRGFTLIELMIVIVLLALMATLAFHYLTPYLHRTVCADVESSVHQAMLQAEQNLAEHNTVRGDGGNTCTSGNYTLSCPDTVAAVAITGTGTAADPITVNGTAVGNKCPTGTNYGLSQNNPRGTWH